MFVSRILTNDWKVDPAFNFFMKASIFRSRITVLFRATSSGRSEEVDG